jgi:kinetochor protein Mis14/NSL1
MAASQYRKIELQSPADLSYLYTNTVNISRRKLDLHLPPPSNNSNGDSNARDPMKERVKELVDEVRQAPKPNRVFVSLSCQNQIVTKKN